MPLFHKPTVILPYEAEVAIVKYEVVIEGTSDGQCNDVTSASDTPLGIALNAAALGETVDVAMYGPSFATAGGTFARGDLLETDATGQLIKVTAAAGTADTNSGGTALSAGTDGERCSVALGKNTYVEE